MTPEREELKQESKDRSVAACGGRLPWLYLPWVWLVFMPFLILSTLFWGLVAIVLTVFSPRVAWGCGIIWAWCLCKANFTRVEVVGREHARPGDSYVIMINHLSHFDVPAFIGHWPKQIRWVLKEELRRIPVFGWYCAAGGHVYVDRSKPKRAVESLREARERIRDGVSVVFFPEGTRSTDGRMGPFKKGGFMTALDLDLPILPVSVSGSQCVLPPGTLRLRPGRIRIRVHAPVDVKPYGLEMRDRLMAHVREIIASGIEEEAVDPRQ